MKDQAQFSLSIFPVLLRKTCARYPALEKERFRSLHTDLFMIIIVIYVHYAIQRQTIWSIGRNIFLTAKRKIIKPYK